MGRWALLFAGLLAFATACDDGEPAAATDAGVELPSGDAAVLSALQRIGAAWAEREIACEQTTPALTRDYWEAYYKNEAKTVGAGRYQLDQAAVGPCVAAIEAMACNEFDDGLPAGCDGLYYSEAAIGEACDPGCVRGAICRLTASSSEPWCSRCIARLGEGASCDPAQSEAQTCGNNLICLEGRCARRPVAAIGEGCGDQADCAQGAYCDGSVCQARKTSGGCFFEECAPGYECFEGSCQPWARVGEECRGGFSCEPHAACGDGRCEAQGIFFFFASGDGTGASCDPEESGCMSVLTCGEASRTCEPRPVCQ